MVTQVTYVYICNKTGQKYVTGESKNWGFFNQICFSRKLSNDYHKKMKKISNATSESWKNKQKWPPKK